MRPSHRRLRTDTLLSNQWAHPHNPCLLIDGDAWKFLKVPPLIDFNAFTRR